MNPTTTDPARWTGPWCGCNQPGARHPLGHEGFCGRPGLRPALVRTLARLRALVTR